MSDFAFKSFEEFESTSKKKKDARAKALKWLFVILFSLLFIEVAVYFFVVPCLGPVKYKFSGLNNCSEKELIEVCGNSLDVNYFSFNKSKIRSMISSVSGVEEVKISKRFPDRVYINVIERKPVAVTFVNDGDVTVPIQIDKNGVLFPVKSAVVPNDGSVPIVSGIPVENIPEGMRLPSKYHLLIDQIAELQAKNRIYFAAVSEIHVVPREYGNFELVLFPVKAHLRVLADRVLNEETLQKMLVTLDAVKGLDSNVDVIDLRYGSISYHSRNDPTGASFE